MLGQQLFLSAQELLAQFGQEWYRLRLTQGQTLLDGKLFGLLFQREQSAQHGDDRAGDLRRGALGLNEVPASMRPTPRASQAVARHHAVVVAVSVGEQNLGVIFQKLLRPIAAAA